MSSQTAFPRFGVLSKLDGMAQPFFPLFDIGAILNLPADWDISSVEVDGPVTLVTAALHNPAPVGRCQCVQPKWVRNGKSRASVRGQAAGGRPVVCNVTFQGWKCGQCGTKGYGQRELGLSNILPAFKGQLGDYLVKHSVADAQREFAVSYDTLTSILHQRLDVAMKERIVLPPQYLAIDDTMIAGRRRLCLLDLERGTYVEIFAGYSGRDLQRYLAEHPEWRATLLAVAIDPYNPFRMALNNFMPLLPVCVDRFHVLSLVQRAIQKWMQVYLDTHNLDMMPKTVWKSRGEVSSEIGHRLVKHPQLLEAVGYVRDLSHMYDQQTLRDALYVWHHWVKSLPPHLEDTTRPTLDYLDTNWRTEICQAVEYRVGTDKPLGTGRLEAKHKRVRYWSEVTPGADFAVLRKRLLLEPPLAEQQQKVKELLRQVEQVRAS